MNHGSASYPKILHIGDKQIADLFDGDVEITEKVDGSQFGFGLIDGKLIIRSKGKELDLEDPDKMFTIGVEYIKSIEKQLPAGVFFYGEYLNKPRHSTLAYDRVPKNNIALFGAMLPDKSMLDYLQLQQEALALKVDIVPLIHHGKSDADHVLTLMETVSFLGGQTIEGVVVKRYEDWMFLGRILTPVKAGKYVTEKFKEVHKNDWGRLNTAKGGFDHLKESLATQARWQKAIQHLKERGDFEGTVRDIGKLIKEIHKDVTEEESENLKDVLWNLYKEDLLRGATRGFVDWYKEQIMKGVYQDV